MARAAPRYISTAQWAAAYPDEFEFFLHLSLGKDHVCLSRWSSSSFGRVEPAAVAD